MSNKEANSPKERKDHHSEPAESVGQDIFENAATDDVSQPEEQDGGRSPTLSEVEELRQQLQDAENRVIRGQAELDNFRKRMRREMEEREKFASESLVKDLLQVADNLQLAIQSAKEKHESGGLLDGVQMVVDLLNGVLAKHHCQQIDALGKPFDPNLHEAVQMQPDAEIPANHVSLEVRSGYTLHDRVIRPPQVFVSTGKPE